MLKKVVYRIGMLKILSRFASGVKRYFAFAAILTAASLGLSFIVPVIYRLFVDRVIVGRELALLPTVVLGYFGCFIAEALFGYARKYSDYRLQNRVLFRVRRALLETCFRIPFAQFEKRNVGDLKMRIDDDAGKLTDFLGVQTIDYTKACVTVVVATIALVAIEWRLALFSIIAIPLTFYVNHRIGKREQRLQEVNRVNDAKQNGWLQASIQGWKEIKALNLQRHEMTHYVRFVHAHALFNSRWINYWVMRVLIIPKIKDEFLMKFALYFFGGLLIMGGQITIGSLLVFATYYNLLSDAVQSASTADADLLGKMPFYDRIIGELHAKNEMTSNVHIPALTPRDIEIRDLCFSYPDAPRPVIDGFSATIRQGERVAIIGPSGAGKTTLMKLISGMLHPDSGTVSWCGVPVGEIVPRAFYSRIGFVMQENLLFNLSIRDNLLFVDPRADQKTLDAACRKACILDFIQSLPSGYDTIIGERGVKLSGGQKQRIVLARLFLREVDLLIFDEATSALDQHSESVIHDAIQAIGRTTTIIVVAHRESSMRLCDKRITLS